jgi:SAM-dependent methyltransferase
MIHDNACGAGAMTDAIIDSSSSASDIYIVATDVEPQLVDRVNQKAREKGWKNVKSEVMPSEDLTFEDNQFTHSFMNLGIMIMEKDVEVAREVYRTLGKDGITVMSIWDRPLPVQVVTAAHNRFRPHATELPPVIKRGGFDERDLRHVLEDAGFDGNGIRFEKTIAVLDVADLKWWASAVWSFVGAPIGGWTPEDERRWDGVIDFMVEWLKDYEGVEKGEQGGVQFTMPAHVAIAHK